jgi:hypothetical protein
MKYRVQVTYRTIGVWRRYIWGNAENVVRNDGTRLGDLGSDGTILILDSLEPLRVPTTFSAVLNYFRSEGTVLGEVLISRGPYDVPERFGPYKPIPRALPA